MTTPSETLDENQSYGGRWVRRIVQLIVSCVILGIGVAMLLRAALGSDGWSTLINGLVLTSGWAFVVMNTVVGIACVAMAWMRGLKPGIGTVVQPVLVGFVVGFVLDHVDEPSDLWAKVVLLILAVPVLVIGVAGYLGSGTGAGPTEAAALAWDPPVPFRWSYMAVQIIGTIVGWLLGGDVGVGTVVVVLLIGPAVDWLSRRFSIFNVHAAQQSVAG